MLNFFFLNMNLFIFLLSHWQGYSFKWQVKRVKPVKIVNDSKYFLLK